MDPHAAFVLEAALCMLINFCLLVLSIYQVCHDLVRHERWRALIVSHYLNLVACLLAFIGHVDGQGGLGIYGQAFVLFITNARVLLILASASAIASGFLSSYQLMTQGPQLPSQRVYEFVIHGGLNALGVILCIALFATRIAWLGVTVKLYISIVSLIQGLNIVVSTLKVRKCLVEEHARTAKYENGIKKLNRLLIFVCVLLVIGNFSILYSVPKDIALANLHPLLPHEAPLVFSSYHILSDCVTLACLAALISGSWKVGPLVQVPKTNQSSTDSHSTDPKKPRSSTFSRPTKSNSSPGLSSGVPCPDDPSKHVASPDVSVRIDKVETNDEISVTIAGEKPLAGGLNIVGSTPEDSPTVTASPRVSLVGYQQLILE